MNYVYVQYDSKHYATALRIDPNTGNLTWDNENGQNVIIVQTPFAINAVDVMKEQICPALSNSSIKRDRFVEVLPEIWVREVTAGDKVRNSGCTLNGRACTYTVFATIDGQNGTIEVFEPMDKQVYASPSVDVPFEIGVNVTLHSLSKGLLFKREVPSGFWMVSFSGSFDGIAGNVGLYYTVETGENAIKIPLTAEAIKTGYVFVKSNSKPVVRSSARGVKVSGVEE